MVFTNKLPRAEMSHLIERLHTNNAARRTSQPPINKRYHFSGLSLYRLWQYELFSRFLSAMN